MWNPFRKATPQIVTINAQTTVEVAPGQTILDAALGAGIAFPHNCRVGGCASCKCKVTKGRVKERTDSGYLLTADELAQGYVLACQSLPLEPLQLEVPLRAKSFAPRSSLAKIVEARLSGRDVAILDVECAEPMPYVAGQWAYFSLESDTVRRSYSFASAPNPNHPTRVQFHIRHVPGGALTERLFSALHQSTLTGTSVCIDGPYGDFGYTPNRRPLLCIAGGTGLAPILAMLQDLAQQKIDRDILLLYGARSAQDLYAERQIQQLRDNWLGKFRYCPVLQETNDSEHIEETGKMTGNVTDALQHFNDIDHSEAYLCGPPGMIDAATQILRGRGLDESHIQADKFLDQSHAVATAA